MHAVQGITCKSTKGHDTTIINFKISSKHLLNMVSLQSLIVVSHDDLACSYLQELAVKAREGKLQLHEFQGGSFT